MDWMIALYIWLGFVALVFLLHAPDSFIVFQAVLQLKMDGLL